MVGGEEYVVDEVFFFGCRFFLFLFCLLLGLVLG